MYFRGQQDNKTRQNMAALMQNLISILVYTINAGNKKKKKKIKVLNTTLNKTILNLFIKLGLI
jgi:hypothetical protein